MTSTIRLASLASAAVKTKPKAGPTAQRLLRSTLQYTVHPRTPAMAPFHAEINKAGRGMQRYSSWAE